MYALLVSAHLLVLVLVLEWGGSFSPSPSQMNTRSKTSFSQRRDILSELTNYIHNVLITPYNTPKTSLYVVRGINQYSESLCR